MNNIAQGYKVNLEASHPSHYTTAFGKREVKGDLVGSFGQMLEKALDDVNTKQVKADNLVVQAGISPDSVEVHDVMNSIAQAELSLNLTKAITDRVVRAYQELINMR